MKSENLEKAKKLYEKWYHSIEMMPDSVKKEFNSYKIPDEIVKKWHIEYINELYISLLNYLNKNPKPEEFDTRYSARMKIILTNFSKNKNNYYKIIEIFEKLHELNLFVIEMKKNDSKYDSFFKLCIICDKEKISKDTIEELPFFSKHRYCGFLETLHREGYQDLFDRLINILCDSIREAGIYFHDFTNDLINYLTYINDQQHITDIEKAINLINPI